MDPRIRAFGLAAWIATIGAAAAPLRAQDAAPDSLEAAKRHAARLVGREDAAFLLVPESSMVKVMPDRAPFRGKPGRPVEIAVAGNEVEGGQVIVAPLHKALTGVTFAVSALSGPDGAVLPDSAVTLEVMGYVHTDPDAKLAYDADRSGWFPDPILPFVHRFDVDRDKVQTLWLDVHCPPGQAPGVYQGKVTVSPANAPADSIGVRVRVFDFTLPAKRSLLAIVPPFIRYVKQIYGDRWNDAMYWKYADFLHAHRLTMDDAYRENEAPPTVERIQRLVADEGLDSWGLRYIRQPGEGYSAKGVDPARWDEYMDQAIRESKAQLAALRKAGVHLYTYVYGFDEVRERHFKTLAEVARRIHRDLPGVAILTTAVDTTFGATSGLGDVDGWISIVAFFNRPVPKANIDRARARGARVLWYTTVWPPRPYPNFFLEYDAIEPRILMGAMTQRYKPDGFAYWALDYWFSTNVPLTKGPYTDWNPLVFGSENGEGSWIYAGRDGFITSIRFENFRDGMEDYEYYKLLERAVARGERRGAPRAALDQARALLAVPDTVLRSLTDFTRDPDVLARHRLDVAETIEALNLPTEGDSHE